jgi:ABC-type phosphate transport system auxiliary subunit
MQPLRQQLAEASQQLSELQGIEERVLDYRAEITRLEDSRRELQQALQMQAAITAEVSMLQREYDALAVQAQHAQRLQEEIPRMQVCLVAGVCFAALCLLQLWYDVSAAILQTPKPGSMVC